MSLPISVFIITKNEEERLPFAIDSVKGWVDEIILVDSGSTDRTLEIAKEEGLKVFHNEWQGYGQQKIFAEGKCKNDWILNIDADEAISEKLKNNIQKIFENGKVPSEAGFEMKWKMIFIGQSKPPLISTGGQVLRLYNIKRAGFRKSTIHDSVVLKNESDKVSFLDGIILHRSFKSYKHWLDKINFYTTEQAEEWVAKSRKSPSILRMIFEPFLTFLKSMFVRKYIFYGVDGFNASIIYAFSKTLRLAKVRELYKLKEKHQNES